MTIEDNKKLVLKYHKAIWDFDLITLEEVLHLKFQRIGDYTSPGIESTDSLESFLERGSTKEAYIEDLRNAKKVMKWIYNYHTMIAEGNKVATFSNLSYTIIPTDATITNYNVVTFVTVEDMQIRSSSITQDLLTWAISVGWVVEKDQHKVMQNYIEKLRHQDILKTHLSD